VRVRVRVVGSVDDGARGVRAVAGKEHPPERPVSSVEGERGADAGSGQQVSHLAPRKAQPKGKEAQCSRERRRPIRSRAWLVQNRRAPYRPDS
jgi:hypothetical protein